MTQMAAISCKTCGAIAPTQRYFDYSTREWVYKSVDCTNCGGKTGEGRHR